MIIKIKTFLYRLLYKPTNSLRKLVHGVCVCWLFWQFKDRHLTQAKPAIDKYWSRMEYSWYSYSTSSLTNPYMHIHLMIAPPTWLAFQTSFLSRLNWSSTPIRQLTTSVGTGLPRQYAKVELDLCWTWRVKFVNPGWTWRVK